MSAYIRSRIGENRTRKWIKKETIQQSLSKIAGLLDKYEEKNTRVVQSIRKEVTKLWEKI